MPEGANLNRSAPWTQFSCGAKGFVPRISVVSEKAHQYMFFKPLFPLCLSFHAHPGLCCNENRNAVSEQTVTKSVILGCFICYVFYIS